MKNIHENEKLHEWTNPIRFQASNFQKRAVNGPVPIFVHFEIA